VKLQLTTILLLASTAAFGCQASASGSLSSKTAEAEAPVVEAPEAAPEPEPEPEPAAEPAVQDPDDVHIEGDHLVIDRHINFKTNSDEILEDSFDLLDHIAQTLKNHPEITTMHVIGHTDAQGNAQHNKQLSERRAASVVAALKERGVSQALDAAGKGKTEHLCNEDTPECHAKNRRVEFVIEKSDS
jgi:outer membrane protein OmpA-like peptidoglycan-associated protein